MSAIIGLRNCSDILSEKQQCIDGDDCQIDFVRKREECVEWTRGYDPWSIRYCDGLVLEKQST